MAAASTESTTTAAPPLRRLARVAKRTALRSTPSAVRRAAAAVDYRRRLLDTRAPKTFTDKLHYKMLRDHRPLLTTFSDKVAVRDYVAGRLGTREPLPALHAVVDRANDLARDQLPREFVLKAAHASGGVVVVTEAADLTATLPDPRANWPHASVHPDRLDWDALRALGDEWLARSYGGGPYREWGYVHVPPRLVVEELLRTPDGTIPDDYKLFVFHGRCRLVQVDVDRFGDHRQQFFLPDWTPLDVELYAPRADVPPPPPRGLDEMLDVAARLGADTDFVRVDLYDLGGRVVFGELTSYVLGGRFSFRPPAFDAEVGSWWDPPRRYR